MPQGVRAELVLCGIDDSASLEVHNRVRVDLLLGCHAVVQIGTHFGAA